MNQKDLDIEHVIHNNITYGGEHLLAIYNSLPPAARKIIEENGKTLTRAGELSICGLLIEDNVNPVTAAEVAVAFPDPVKFKPEFLVYSGLKKEYKWVVGVEARKHPLEAMYDVAKLAFPTSGLEPEPKSKIEKKIEEFYQRVTELAIRDLVGICKNNSPYTNFRFTPPFPHISEKYYQYSVFFDEGETTRIASAYFNRKTKKFEIVAADDEYEVKNLTRVLKDLRKIFVHSKE